MTSPRKTEAPGWQARGSEGQETADACDFASASNDHKGFAALQAAYALQGYALHRLTDSLILVERWGYSRTLDNMTQAAQFLTQIGGR